MKKTFDIAMTMVALFVGYSLLSVAGALPFVGHVSVNGQDYTLWGAMCFALIGAMAFRDGAKPTFEWIASVHKKTRLGRAG